MCIQTEAAGGRECEAGDGECTGDRDRRDDRLLCGVQVEGRAGDQGRVHQWTRHPRVRLDPRRLLPALPTHRVLQDQPVHDHRQPHCPLRPEGRRHQNTQFTKCIHIYHRH